LKAVYRDATVWLPGPPSVAGPLVCRSLQALEAGGPLPEDPSGADSALRYAAALREAERLRDGGLVAHLFDPDWLDRALRAPPGSGFTTHISAVDAEGGAVAITHSLGETCGHAIPGTGLLLNNFLGESDVNPPDAPRAPGQRLYTMCCPTLIERGDRCLALGTGGSSRIRSAVLQGVSYLVDRGLSPDSAVSAPRIHVERGVLHVEAGGRPAAEVARLRASEPDAVIFEDRHLFFGGLHVAAFDGDRYEGAGDARRSGCWGCA